ncbi:ABC transporter permease [Microbulbifer sp. 2304DJ12-6]|uniref:ABC transporter permease n=1 Tax=Microbulbifer sp. 2304DJ12-6 TaxID=3233340 RepID=UPI0039B0B2FD
MISFELAWNSFWRENSNSDSRLILTTQFLLIFFLLTLTLTSASVQHYLHDNLQNLLGSDMVISRYQPLSKTDKHWLEHQARKVSETQLFDITLTHGQRWERVQLKVVDNRYPVQGQLEIGLTPTAQHHSVEHGPKAGELWVGPRLFTKLGLELGQSVTVGKREFTVNRVLFHEPDRILEGHSAVALRAMVNRESLQGMPLNAGKKRYRYLVDAHPSQQQQISSWFLDKIPHGQIITKANSRHPLSNLWKRVENFIGLSSIILFFMAAIAIDLAGRRQLSRQQRKLALYMSMGMEMKQGASIAIGQWFLGFLLSLAAGIVFAYAASYSSLLLLQTQFPDIRPDWYWVELTRVILLVFILLFGFQLPGLIKLKKTSIVSLLQAHNESADVLARTSWNFACLAVLTVFYSDNGTLTAMTLGAMLCALIIMMLTTWLLLICGEKLTRYWSGLLPFTFFIMRKRLLSKSTQVIGFGFCCTLLLFTLMLMKDIGVTLEANRRVNDGNLVIARAEPDQLSAIHHWSKESGSRIRQIRPYTSAQLLKVNGYPLLKFSPGPSESMLNLRKPIRLSWSDQLPDNNRVVSGRWWPPESENWKQISVESEVASDLGLKLGDKLSFMVGGKIFDFSMIATHAFKPGKGSVTFWFQVPQVAVDHLQPEVAFMGSMELPEDAWGKLSSLWRHHPTLILVPLKALTDRFDQTLALFTKLVLGFNVMIVALALVVVAASVKGFEEEERKKNGLILSMGLDKFDCLKLNIYEWIITASIAAAGAIGGNWAAGVLIYQSQFSLVYRPDPMWIASVTLATIVVVSGVGLFYYYARLQSSISDLLAE